MSDRPFYEEYTILLQEVIVQHAVATLMIPLHLYYHVHLHLVSLYLVVSQFSTSYTCYNLLVLHLMPMRFLIEVFEELQGLSLQQLGHFSSTLYNTLSS